jgi:hypothetical protein
MPSYNPTAQDNQNLGSSNENKGLYNRLLRGLSNFGMRYDDMIIRNTVGIGINEDPLSQKNNSMYDFFSQRAVANVLNRKSIPYLDKSYADKRRILREYSIKDEIRDYIATIADECIIFNGNDFCQPKPLSNNFSNDIKDKYQEFFEKIYNKFGFSDGITAWNMMKDFLIDGFLALEIIWDDKKQNIISFNRLRPDTLVPAYEPSIGNLWIQFPEDPQLRRIFLDSQLVFISYSTQNDFSETSYIEGLIKPYNQLKILEQTRIMFNIINATVYQKFTIPTKGLSKHKAEEQIGQLIANYSEHVDWDDSLGTLRINGSKHLPFNKQVWFPEGDFGTPNMELVSPTGTDLNEETTLKYFLNALKRASRIPQGRFDHEAGGGSVLTMESNDVNNDEQKFGNFIGRIRANFREIMTKPMKLQMCMEFPELKDDDIFINQVDIEFANNQTIEEWKKIRTYQKKIEAANAMLLFLKTDGTPYFHPEFLVNTVLKLSPAEISENNSYWLKSKAAGEKVVNASGESVEPGGMGGGPSSVQGGGSEFDFGAQGEGQAGAAQGAPGQGQAGAEGAPSQGQAGASQGQGPTKEFDF